MPRSQLRSNRPGEWRVEKSGLIVDAATSNRMRGIRRIGTSPELTVRRWLWRAGVRFRCHNKDLPGSPDIANRARSWAIFVHGCFWHGHKGCRAATMPKRNRRFWRAKIVANRLRDARKLRALRSRDFSVVVLWECEIKSLEKARSQRRIDHLIAPIRRRRPVRAA